jgi:LysM repeat protein
MAQQRISKPVAERRCPNCGTRVARDAESCFMCGHDLRIQPKRKRRVSLLDALLVVAVLAVLLFWWQAGSRGRGDEAQGPDATAAVLLPTDIPVLQPVTATVEAAPPAPEPTLAPVPTPVETMVTEVVEHTVAEGDTLISIAIRYGVTVEALQSANGLSDVLIRPGEKLQVPVTRRATLSPPGTTSSFEYTVVQGDTIVAIATRFGAALDDVLRANNLTANAIIRPGDRLIVPVQQVSPEVLGSAALVPSPTPAGPAAAPDEQATPEPTAVIYLRPQLTAPTDGAALPRTEPVLLRWVSVDLLAPNEWYVLLLYPRSDGARALPTIWTKSTSHRLGTEAAPAEGATAEYDWQVSVVRVGPGSMGGYALEAASPSSELRSFTWQ